MAVIILGSGITPVIGTREFAPIPGSSSGGGATGVTFFSGDVVDYVLTSTGLGDSIKGNPNLRFTGSVLFVTGNLNMPSGNITVAQMTPNATSSILHYDPVSGRVTYGSSGGGTTRYLRADGTWAIPTADGWVSVDPSATVPLDGQITYWTGGTTVRGSSLLTFDGTGVDITGTLTVSGEVDFTGMNPGVTTAVVTYNTFTGELTYSDSGGGTTNFLRADGAWAVPAGGVSVTGTPLDNQLAIWTNSTTVEGVSALGFYSSILRVDSEVNTQAFTELSAGLGLRFLNDVIIGADTSPNATLDIRTSSGSNPALNIRNTGSGYGIALLSASAATAQQNRVIDAGTTTIVRGLDIERLTDGTAAAGLGTGISLSIEYDSGVTQTSAAIDTIITDPVYASGDADLSFKTNRANVLEESMLLTSIGVLQVDTINELTASAGVTIEGILVEDSDITIPTANYAYFNVGETAYIFDDSGDLTFEDDNIGPVTLTTLAATGASFGSDTQVPYTNVAGTDLLYTANLVYEDGTGAMELKITTDDGSNLNEGLTVRNLDDGANPGRVNLLHERVTGQSAQADDLLGAVVGQFYNTNGSPAIEEGTVVEFKVTDVTDTAEETEINQYVMDAGSITQLTTLTSDGLEYLADHSTAQAANVRWIVDKDYVDTEIGAAGGLSASGTPVNDQVAVWTDASTLEGTANFTFVGTTLDVNNTLTVDVITEHTGSAGVTIETVVLEDGGITVPDLTGTGTRIVTASAAGLLAEDNLSGHISTTNSLVTAIGATAITDQSALAAFASGDSFLVYDTDAAALREGTVSALQTYMEANLAMTGYAVIDGTPGATRIGVWTSSTEIEGGTDLTWDGSTLDVSGDITVPALGVIYLDGGGNTYILESSADTMDLVSGGNTMVSISATETILDGILRSEATDTDDIGTNTYWWNDVYAQKYNVDVNTAYIDYSGTELQFTDGVSGTVALSTLAAGNNVWTKTGTDLSPTTAGDDILLTMGTERITFSGGSSIWESDSNVIQINVGSTAMLFGATSVSTYKDFIPGGDKSYDVGSATYFFDNAYVDTLFIDDVNTYIDIDTGDMTFTDTNSGTVTLASLVAGGAAAMTWTGSTANAVGTYGDADSIIAEGNLTFDGTILTLGASNGRLTFTDEIDIRRQSSKRFYIDEATDTIRIGYNTGDDANTGHDNVFIGYNSGGIATGAASNTVVGYGAGTTLGTGDRNTLLGYNAGLTISTGSYNVALGTYAMEDMNDSTNIAIGYEALRTAASGNYMLAIGYQAGKGDGVTPPTGTLNTFIGHFSGNTYTTGVYNIALGYSALRSVTTGGYNVVIGNNAGYANTGSSNTILGDAAGYYGSGDNNVFLGRGAGQGAIASSGYSNIFIGRNAGNDATSGNGNIIIGYDVQKSSATASNELRIGYISTIMIGGNPSTGVVTLPSIAGSGTGTSIILYNRTTKALTYGDAPTGGGMIYPAAGIALSTGSGWDGTSVVNNSAEWNTAFDHTSLTNNPHSVVATDVITLGADTQVPYMNGTTDFQYSANLTFSGSVLDVNDSITVDTINEHTGSAGVTIEGVLLENNDITLPLTTGTLIFGDGSTFIYSSADDRLDFYADSTIQLRISEYSNTTYSDFRPATNRNIDLGNQSSLWFETLWVTNVYFNDGSSNDLYYHIEVNGTDMRFSDGSNSNVTLSDLVSGTGDISWGTETGTQPIVFGANGGDIDSDADVTWNTTTETFTIAGNTYITGLSADDTELHLVAIDNSTGELTKRTVSSITVAGTNWGSGLYEDAGTIRLGGALTSNITFSGSSGYQMTFGTWGSPLSEFNVVSDEEVDLSAQSHATHARGQLLLEPYTASLISIGLADANIMKIKLGATSGIEVTDAYKETGLYYATNYVTGGSALGNRWIPDKAYVDSVSDIRLKENILPIEGGVVSKLMNLQGYTFNLKEDESKTRKFGLIAQEVIEDFPEAVHEMDEGYMGIYYKDMVAVLVEAIKEQQVEIDKLKEHLNLK